MEGAFSCAMLAIGGYGRGELSPGSDIDLMFVFPKRSTPASRLVRIILYLLWDSGLDIGHSARTISECIRIGREDYQSETSMLEHRLIAGDEAVFGEFHRRFDSYLKRVSKSSHLRRRLRELGLDTLALPDAACLSACPYALAGSGICTPSSGWPAPMVRKK